MSPTGKLSRLTAVIYQWFMDLTVLCRPSYDPGPESSKLIWAEKVSFSHHVAITQMNHKTIHTNYTIYHLHRTYVCVCMYVCIYLSQCIYIYICLYAVLRPYAHIHNQELCYDSTTQKPLLYQRTLYFKMTHPFTSVK